MRGGPPPRFRGRGFGPRGPMFRGANNGYPPFECPPRPNCPHPNPAGPRFRGPPPFDPSWGHMGPPNMMGPPGNMMPPPGMVRKKFININFYTTFKKMFKIEFNPILRANLLDL